MRTLHASLRQMEQLEAEKVRYSVWLYAALMKVCVCVRLAPRFPFYHHFKLFPSYR